MKKAKIKEPKLEVKRFTGRFKGINVSKGDEHIGSVVELKTGKKARNFRDQTSYVSAIKGELKAHHTKKQVTRRLPRLSPVISKLR